VYVILSNIIIQLITLVQLFYHATCFPIETKLIIYIYIYIKKEKKEKKKERKLFMVDCQHLYLMSQKIAKVAGET
jgi:hypothetical protein